MTSAPMRAAEAAQSVTPVEPKPSMMRPPRLGACRDRDADSVGEPAQWPLNLGSSQDLGFIGQPAAMLEGRRLPLSMGEESGGGSGINVMVWTRGHREDWNCFAAESGDDAWGYESVLGYCRRIEDWRGAPDPTRRGVGGPMHVAQPDAPQPIAHAMLESAKALGIPVFDSVNGAMMEAEGGAAIADLRILDGKRQSVSPATPWRRASSSAKGRRT
ncbi:GMC family oxidoreductase [Rhizobium sp. G21]|nr:GMC family oxidoreductase [Rhizobium sp. G21]